jgi:hypothetical protein
MPTTRPRFGMLITIFAKLPRDLATPLPILVY